MTKVFYNGSIKNFRGRIGNLIFRQLPDGTTVVSQARPKETGRRKKRAKERRSPRQKDHNERFLDASAYARKEQTQPVYVELAAAAPMKTAYNFAVSDWFKPPVIHRIERRNGQIRVEATDNIGVVRVRVTVRDEQGQVMEQGEATRGRGNWWKFTPRTAGRSGSILAEAWDLPKHRISLILE
jgi:hypothetical protein